jgi:hypothetical protein
LDYTLGSKIFDGGEDMRGVKKYLEFQPSLDAVGPFLIHLAPTFLSQFFGVSL